MVGKEREEEGLNPKGGPGGESEPSSAQDEQVQLFCYRWTVKQE